MHHQTVQGDCLELMRTLPDDSIDLVFTSPPYEDARTYGIDFNLKGRAWVDWCMPRFMECVRVCRGLVAWVVNGRTRNFSWSCTPIMLMYDLYAKGVTLRKPPIFNRDGVPGSGGSDWLRDSYEFIICTTKGGKLPWSNNTAMADPPKFPPGGAMSYRVKDGTRVGKKLPIVRRSKDLEDSGIQKREVQSYIPPELSNPGNVIKCIVGGSGALGSKLAHETEAPFPEHLAEFFVLSFCRPGGTVLDPFCGSGTTLAVAELTGRNAIGIDIRANQCELTERRIQEAKDRKPPLPPPPLDKRNIPPPPPS